MSKITIDIPQEVNTFKERLAEHQARLEKLFRAQASPETLVLTRSNQMDRVLQQVWRLFVTADPNAKQQASLIAVGGYGRQELNPYSDIDILILLGSQNRQFDENIAKPLVRFLWDIGLEIGYSVRTLSECRQIARSDITVMTSLLESRHCAGSLTLYKKLQALLQNPKIWSAKKFFDAKIKEQQFRHRKFADTAYNLEPNIKEGPGGLRDIHTIAWVANRQFGFQSLHDLVSHGFLHENEYQTLIEGRNYLWQLRNALHFLQNRREDRLLFAHQLQLAKHFGYLDDDNNRAVEKLMKRYFRTVAQLRYINSILLQHFDESFITRKRRKTKIVNQFILTVDGYLDFIEPKQVENHPILLLELCVLFHSNPNIRGVRASALRLLRTQKSLITDEVRKLPAVKAQLLKIFSQPDRIALSLRLMSDTGLLGVFIPEFELITGQLQYDLFHVYTVDAHLLNVVWHLQQLNQPSQTNELKLAREAMKRVVKPERLFIAALFHDIGKGQGADHSELGETISYEFCKYLGMSEYDSHFVAWLVKFHLLMSFTSQKENLNDPQVISQFAKIVGNQDHLDHLYLLTIADMKGTSPTVWNDWKGEMLTQLYLAASRSLLMDAPPHDAIESRIEEIKSDAFDLLDSHFKLSAAAQKYWEFMDDEYFLSNDAGTLAWHVQRASDVSAVNVPVVSFRVHPSINVVQLFIFAPNFEELFTVVTGALDRCHLNVFEARNHPLKTGMIAFTFVVSSRNRFDVLSNQQLRQFEKEVRDSIINTTVDHVPSLFAPDRVARHLNFSTTVDFYQSPSNDYTIMEISAQDRPGLLYFVVRTLLNHKIHLLSAKITTIGARAEDVFFLVDRDGNPLNDDSVHQILSSEITQTLQSNFSTKRSFIQ